MLVHQHTRASLEHGDKLTQDLDHGSIGPAVENVSEEVKVGDDGLRVHEIVCHELNSISDRGWESFGVDGFDYFGQILDGEIEIWKILCYGGANVTFATTEVDYETFAKRTPGIAIY